MKCPKCPEQVLATSEVKGIQIDQCGQCGGVWCDSSELSRLLAIEAGEVGRVARSKANPEASAKAGKCPRDGTQMLRVASAKNRTVIIETCPDCRGIWLDGGELKELLAG